MPRPSISLSIPARLRQQLHDRLLASNFSDLVEVAAWLTAHGVQMKKSALAVYVRQNAADIRLEAHLRTALSARQLPKAAELRMRCIEAAAVACAGKPEQLVPAAREALAWAIGLPAVSDRHNPQPASKVAVKRPKAAPKATLPSLEL